MNLRGVVRPADRWPGMQRQPAELARGLCVTHPNRDWWSSDGPDQREAACHVCARCPVRGPCFEYSLTLPASDRAIYAGTTAAERARLRRARQEGAA